MPGWNQGVFCATPALGGAWRPRRRIVAGTLACRHTAFDDYHSQRQDAPTLTTDFYGRFEAECLPRIVDAIGKQHRRVQLHALPAEAPNRPPRLRMTGDGPAELRRHAHPLDVTLAWDGLEVQRLFGAGGEARFAGYLAALPGKLRAWQEPRGIDFGSLSQTDPAILIGGLDFER